MNEAEKLSLEQIRAFLEASGELSFEAKQQSDLYSWISGTLGVQRYASLPRSGKGLVKKYLEKMTGLSRAQITRLVARHVVEGDVKVRRGRRNRFQARYTTSDVQLLAHVDEAHDTLSGPATQKILYRELHEFAEAGYERLASISVAHIYNLRKRRAYRERRSNFEKTRPTPVSIGASAASRGRTGGLATCGWTRCIRAISTASKACITSTPWTK